MGFNFHKCLGDLGDQISGKLNSLEAVLINYPIYQEKTRYKKHGTDYAGGKTTLTDKVALQTLYILTRVVGLQGIPPHTHPFLAVREQRTCESAWKKQLVAGFE